MKKEIRRQERIFAIFIVRSMQSDGVVGDDQAQRLETALEYFLTWRLKLGCGPQLLWCDGTSAVQLNALSPNEYCIEGKARIGPEGGNAEDLFPVDFLGTIRIDASRSSLKAYHLVFSGVGNRLVARKAI